MTDKDKHRKTLAGDGSKERRSSRKRSRSRSSSDSRSVTSSSSSRASSASGRSRTRSRSSHRHRRWSRSHSGSHGRRPRERQQQDRHRSDHHGSSRHDNSRDGYAARGQDDRYQWQAKKEELRSNETAALSKTDTKTPSSKATASANSEKKVESASSDVKPTDTTIGSQVQVLQPPIVRVTKPVAVAAGSMTAPTLQMLKTSAASQLSAASSEANSASTFSRDSIVRNLQEMVKPAASEISRTLEEVELNEKEKSALEFAISMYMAANEFYDGGSLWCRQCDSIFTDISAMCRHIHSDKHQLVSFTLLQSAVDCHK